MPGEIFYYVHHDGGGHRGRAAAICRELPSDVTLFSSLPPPADLSSWAPNPTARREWIRLDPDTDLAAGHPEPTAGGRLHWAPLHQHGLQSRHARLLAEIARRRPSLLVSDVSVEIAVLSRLSGVPTAVVLQPGRRDDAPHRLALDLAVGILAPWPRPIDVPDWLEPWLARTVFTGGISAARPREPDALPTSGTHRRVLVAFGAGEEPVDEVRAAAAATPDWSWQVRADATGDWWQRLDGADVVVAHAGLGTIADLATIGARAVLIPQSRPFGEQQAAGELVRELRVAPVLERWPDPVDWPDLLEQALHCDPSGWAAWGVADGARIAARQLTDWSR